MIFTTIDTDLQRALKSLSVALVRQEEAVHALSSDAAEMIQRWVRISTIGASTRIENALLTDAEVDWLDTCLSEDGRPTALHSRRGLIENKLSRDRERSIEEVAGCRAMLQIILDQHRELLPLTEHTLRGLHQELLQFYAPARHYGGCYKRVSNSVIQHDAATGERITVLKTADPGPITEAAMHELVAWYNETLGESPWTPLVACEFVYQFLAIHPFQDGNGRLARGLFLLSLLHGPDETLRLLAPYLAIDRQVEARRAQYYLALRRCSAGQYLADPTQYRMRPFVDFMLTCMGGALREFQTQQARYAAFVRLSPAGQRILACFREHPEVRLQTKALAELTGLPQRTVTANLATLARERFIQSYGAGRGRRYQLTF